MNNQEQLTTTLNRVIKDRFFNYRGCCVEKIIGGFRWNNHTFKNYTELDKHIDETYKAIAQSIQKSH